MCREVTDHNIGACRVDVTGHVAKWEDRVRVWQYRFQLVSNYDSITISAR